MNIKTNFSELVGNTPLFELQKMRALYGFKARLFAKLEAWNPAGSAKDRVALHMIDTYMQQGLLGKDTLIIEPTSGNTGIGLAAVCASRGIHLCIVMPDTMSVERQLLIKAYGAELVLSDGKLGMKGAIAMAEEMHRQRPDSIIAGQFINPANPEAHYVTTGPEIWEGLDGQVDAFVASVGTGGTITGVGRFLKEKRGDVRVVAVEPSESPVLSGGAAGPHTIQGIGAGFVPEVLDTKVYDEIITVSGNEAFEVGRKMAVNEGLLVGISSGAAMVAAIKVASRLEYAGRNVVVLLPDTGARYLSTPMFK